MKRYALFALLTILLLLTVSALAQDDATAVPTDSDVPAETQEATSAAATEEAIATQEVVVIVTQTPENSPTPTLTPTPEMTAIAGTGGNDGSTGGTTNGGSPDAVYLIVFAVVIGLFALSAVDRWTNFKLSQTAISQVPADYRPWVLQGAETLQRQVYEKAGEFARSSAAQWDDNILNEEMKRAGWEFYTAADGVQHARKIVAPAVSPQG